MAVSTTNIPQGYIELVKYAERIFAADKSARLVAAVATEKGNVIGFTDMADEAVDNFDRIKQENRFLHSLAECGETVISCGLFLWKSGELDIPSANFRKRLVELNSANLEAEFLLRGGNGFVPRKLREMRPGV